MRHEHADWEKLSTREVEKGKEGSGNTERGRPGRRRGKGLGGGGGGGSQGGTGES